MVRYDDYGEIFTDIQIEELEKEIAKIYKKAGKDIKKDLDRFFAQFVDEDEKKRQQLEDGEITKQEYQNWRINTIRDSKEFAKVEDKIAAKMVAAAVAAVAVINSKTSDVYTMNRCYSNYRVASAGVKAGKNAADEILKNMKFDMSFSIYNKAAVDRLMKQSYTLIPWHPKPKTVKQKLEYIYVRGVINKEITSGIVKGDSIPKIAKALNKKIPHGGIVAATRTARTAMTAAQNGGRQASMEAAIADGFQFQKEWIALKDSRTRWWHGLADGLKVDVSEPFIVGGEKLMFPGDNSLGASGWNIYNCRCKSQEESRASKYGYSQLIRIRDFNTGKYIHVTREDEKYLQWMNHWGRKEYEHWWKTNI